MEQVVTKFGSHKIDNDADTAMCCDAIYFHTTSKKITTLSIMRNVYITTFLKTPDMEWLQHKRSFDRTQVAK